MPKTSPQGDVGAAILTKPWAAPVPGSIAWRGTAGPDLGERWSFRLVATAASVSGVKPFTAHRAVG
jgi:hypothetical protein